jgi:photosystem II stability/assembly factor-like uncharacterized protein
MAGDGVVLVLGSASRGGLLPFRVADARGTRLGRVAAPANAVPAVAGGHLNLAAGCGVTSSGDGGSTWRSSALPGCRTAGLPGPVASVTASGDTAWVGGPDGGTWRTTDGGASWSRLAAADFRTGVPTPASPTLGYRLVAATHLGPEFQRTRDGGSTWEGLGYTGVPQPGQARGSFYNVLPGLGPHAMAVLPDGTLLLGGGSDLVVVRADEAVGTAMRVPVPDGLAGTGDPFVTTLACDAAGTCVVGVGRSGTEETAGLLFRDGAFGARTAPPRASASSPAPGVLIAPGDGTPRPGGPDGPPRTVLQSDDLGSTYRTIAADDGPVRALGGNGTLAVPAGEDLHVSADHGASWRRLPLPASPALTQVTGTPDELVALGADGTVLRFVDDRWATVADVASVRPRALAMASGVPVVVGDGGIARVPADGAPRIVPAPAGAGRGYARVTAAGPTVVAWAPGRRDAARSTDGGTTWRAVALPVPVDDLQLASPTRAYAVAGRDLFASDDGGRRLRRVSSAPAMGAAGQTRIAPPGPLLSFSSRKRGTVITPSGVFLTGNGGRSLESVPTPDALLPPFAAVAGDGVVVQDPITGVVLRDAALLSKGPTAIRVTTSTRPRRSRDGSRVVRVVGRVQGAGLGEPVAVLRVARRGTATSRAAVVRTGTRGRFVAIVRVPRSVRGVQVRFRGSVRAGSTLRGGVSRVLPVR